MPTGFSQTAERLSQSGFKVRELIEPADSSVPNSEDLSASLGTQLAALAQPIEDTATFSDKIANDLAELVAQLNALSFAREDVASIASNAFSQSDALNKLVSALPLTSEEVSETARTLQGVATQLSDIQTQQPFTLDELSRGYLQAIEQADSTKQQSLMLAQLAELSKFASGSATDIQALRSFAQQDARLNVYQTKQLNDIVGLLQTVAAENGSLQYSLDDLVAAQSTQTDQQRRQHKETALAADKAHEQAQAQLDHDKDTREEHNKQRDFDLREAQKQQAAQERAEKNASAGGAAEEQSGGTSFLTKLMQSDLAGMREDLIGSALGVFGMSSLTEVVSDSIREKGDQRAEREAEASEKAQGEDADQQASDSEQQDKSFLRILGETTAESLRADLIQTALGSLGLGSLAEPIEEYLQNKAEPTDPQSDPTQTDTQSTAESAQKNKKASDDVEYSEVEKDDNGGYRATRDSNISSTTPIEGLSAGQQSAEQVDIFKKRDTDQAHANSALDKLVTQSAQANDMLKQIVQSVSTNAKSNTTNNNDRREDLSRLNTARSGMSSRTMMMMPQRRMPRGRMTRASMRRGGVMMSAMPMMPASRAATRMQSRSRMMPMASPVMMSMAAPMMTPMAMGMANQQPNLLAPPRAKSQRQSQRRGAAQKGMMSKALSPMMQLSTNPLAGHDGKALVGSTTKLNEKEMDVIAQEMLLIKEMRRTLNRIEAALPDQGIFSSLLGGGGILGALFEAGSELGDLMGGRRRNKRKDRMGRQDVETGRRGRRGGTRGGRVRSLVANTAATTSTAVGGIATSILGGGGGGILDAGAGLLDLASEFVDFGPEEEDFDRERSRRNRKGGGRGGSKGGTRGKFPTRSTGGPSTAGRTPPGPSTGSGKSAGKSAGKRGFKGAAKGIAKGAAKLAPMLLNPVLGAAVLAGSAAYSLYDGWNSAGENFGLEEGQEASLGQKMSSAAGSLISDVSFGLLDGGSVSRGIHSLGSTVGGWFGFGDDEEEALPSSSEKIANSEIAVPNVPMEVLNEDALPSPETLATGAALASTSLAPGTSLPDEKVAQLVQQHQTLNKATGTPPLHSRMTDATKAALTTAQVSPNKAALDSADKSGATSLATEGDKPSLASRMMDAAKTAVSYTPIGMMATAASNLFSSDDSGAATVTAENEKPSIASRMMDAAKTAVSYTPIGMMATAASNLFSSDDSGAATVTAENEKPSIASRMMDAAKTAVSFTPLGMMATAASNLFSSDDSGAATVTADSDKPSIASRMMDAAKTAVSFTPLGMMATTASNLLSSDDSGATSLTAEGDKPSIASRMMDAAKTAASFTPLGMTVNAASSLFSSDDSGATSLTAESDKPSIASRMMDAAKTAVSYTPLGMMATTASNLLSSDDSGAANLATEGDKPSIASRMMDAAKTAASLTPLGMTVNAASSLFSSDDSGAANLATEGDKPSIASRMMDAAKTAASLTPLGMTVNAASSLFSSDDSGATNLATEGDKPSLTSRMMDAAKTAASFTPLGMMATTASNLFSSDESGAASLTTEGEKPSLTSRMMDAAKTAASFTPLGMMATGINHLMTSSPDSSNRIAAKDGTFFNPVLSEQADNGTLFMGDDFQSNGKLSSSTAVSTTGLNNAMAIANESSNAFNAERLSSGKNESVSAITQRTLSTLKNSGLLPVDEQSNSANIASRPISTAQYQQLLSDTQNKGLDATTASSNNASITQPTVNGSELVAHVELPPALKDAALLSDTLLSPNVQAQLAGAAKAPVGKASNNRTVSASRPAPVRTMPRGGGGPKPSSSGQKGSFHVDDTGIAIMNSILFD